MMLISSKKALYHRGMKSSLLLVFNNNFNPLPLVQGSEGLFDITERVLGCD